MEPLTPKSTYGSSNLTTSSTLISRYGEPFHSVRPTSDEQGTWPVPLPDSGKCYEELELERRNVSIAGNLSVSLQFGNHLSILAGPDSTVEVIVDTTSWHLHRALLIHYSSVFQKALSDRSKRRISLKEFTLFPNPTEFTLFVQWLYTSDFNFIAPIDPLRAYIFGSTLGAVGFQNKAIHKMHDLNQCFCTITAYTARIIFHLEVGFGLRQLAVDVISLGFLTHELDVNAEEWKEVLGRKNAWSEVMSSMARQYTQTWKSKRPEEYYDVV